MFKRLLYIFLFLLAGVAAFAQQYPVQGSFAIASPYPANLSDYANSNIQSLALNLTLTDLNMANKRVRLKLFIQTQNATIAQSIDNISGEPLIMLDGGIPQRFTNTELAHYFRLENLQGINPDGYARSLPEGVYTIGFEVYDYFTGNKLSGRIGQTFWIIINDPPLLNTPTDKSKIADFTSGSRGNGGIIFNWTPRSSQVSNTEYEFTLCELWDATGDAYQQFMSAIPKYQTTVSNSTTLIYSLAQPMLISGYTYAWRVRAKAKAGFEDIGLYRNDGYSNLFTFRYGDPCPAPQSLALEAKSSDAIAATWDAPVGATTGGIRYKIAYRKYSAAGQWSWAETETSDLFRTISDLEAATEYEIKVGVPCNNGNSTAPLSPGRGDGGEVVFTPSQRITTLPAGQITGIECGKEPTIDLSQQTLLTLLKAGDVVMANDFPTTISSVTGTSQGWSGEAWTKVPWLGDTRIHVTYASIKVNSDHKLIDGSFDTVYNPSGKNIGDVDQTVEDISNFVADITTPFVVPDKFTIQYDSIKGTVTFTNANGTSIGTTVIPQNTDGVQTLPITLQDKDGKTYEVRKNEETKQVEAIYLAENAQQAIAFSPVSQEEGQKRITNYAEKLRDKIKSHTEWATSTDPFIKQAYLNAELLPKISIFNSQDGSGGACKGKQIFIGYDDFTRTVASEMEGDIMSTLFHEFMHYLNHHVVLLYPYKYINEEEGEIYSFKTTDTIFTAENQSEFFKRVKYEFCKTAVNGGLKQLLIEQTYGKGKNWNGLTTIQQENITIMMNSKRQSYFDYDELTFDELTNSQLDEFDYFIKTSGLTLNKNYKIVNYTYSPSNYRKDELNAYQKTYDAEKINLFSISSIKRSKCNNSIQVHKNGQIAAEAYEKKYGYNEKGEFIQH